MNRPLAIAARPLAALGLLLLILVMSGCYNPFAPRIAPVLGFSQPPPAPSSPSNLMRLFEWCYNNRAIAEYRELFTGDYQFFFNPVDSAGAAYRAKPWRREDEMIYATQLFVGGSADQPAANSIRLSLDKNFYVYADPKYLRWDPQGIWHKNIRSQALLTIKTDDGSQLEVSGAANFFLVRGDSAVIPDELKLMGFVPDSTRWFIRQWDDETAVPDQGGGGGEAAKRVRSPRLAAAPAPHAAMALPEPASWGYAKIYYRRR
jgi:hypothetical protein